MVLFLHGGGFTQDRDENAMDKRACPGSARRRSLRITAQKTYSDWPHEQSGFTGVFDHLLAWLIRTAIKRKE